MIDDGFGQGRPAAFETVRRYLDDTGYAFFSTHQPLLLPNVVCPPFDQLQTAFEGLNPLQRLLFSLFRQGHVAEERVLAQALPKDVLLAMQELRLLVRNERGHWGTADVALLPVEGLLLAVSLPPLYGTARDKRWLAYFAPESMALVPTLPTRVAGRVLAVGEAHGFGGLLCAERGAASTTILVPDGPAERIARFNVQLNGLADRVDVRTDDLARPGGPFDLVVCVPPFIPDVEGSGRLVGVFGGREGSEALRSVLRRLEGWASADGEALLICGAVGDQHSIYVNQEALVPLAREASLHIRAYVSLKIGWSQMEGAVRQFLQHVLRDRGPDDYQRVVDAWKHWMVERGTPAEYWYTQAIRIRHCGHTERGELVQIPLYAPELTDPLTAFVLQQPRARR